MSPRSNSFFCVIAFYTRHSSQTQPLSLCSNLKICTISTLPTYTHFEEPKVSREIMNDLGHALITKNSNSDAIKSPCSREMINWVLAVWASTLLLLCPTLPRFETLLLGSERQTWFVDISPPYSQASGFLNKATFLSTQHLSLKYCLSSSEQLGFSVTICQN